METKVCKKCKKEKIIAEFKLIFFKNENKSYREHRCLGCRKIYNQQWITDHPEHRKKYNVKAQAKILKENPTYYRDWARRNNEKARVTWHNQFSTKNGDDNTVTAEALKALMYKQNNQCNFCKIEITNQYHIDHIIPLSKGGLHSMTNIQLLCPMCNWKKGTKILINPQYYGQCKPVAT